MITLCILLSIATDALNRPNPGLLGGTISITMLILAVLVWTAHFNWHFIYPEYPRQPRDRGYVLFLMDTLCLS